jgi:FtsH-binding integral membrane protein
MEENQPLLNEENKKKAEQLIEQELEKKVESEIKKEIRRGFIFKVYGLLFIQLALTFFFVYLANEIKSLRNFIIYHYWLYFFISLIPLGIMIIFICNPQITRRVPSNYILLFIFTMGEGYFLARFTLNFQRMSIYISLLLTLIAVITLTIYAFVTKSDFTLCGGLLWVLLVLNFFGLLFVVIFRLSILYTFLKVFGIVLFSLYLIYDTQLIEGNHSYKLSEDDYIWGVIMLYLDIINLFLYILSFFVKNN